MTDADVIVIGAGPVGLYSALRLARKGWSVHVVERWAAAYGRPRAVGLDGESLRALHDVGLAEVMASGAERNRFFDWRNGDGETILLLPIGGQSLTGWEGVTFTQPDLEARLEEALRAEPRATISRGVEVVGPDSITVDDDGVSIVVHDTESREQVARLRGRYVIGADGARSVVREKIGVPMVDLGFFYDWLVVDVIPTGDRDWGDRGIQDCSPQRPTTIVPGGAGRRRWEFMLLPGESPEEMGSEDVAWSMLAKYGVDPSNARLERHVVYRFQARWAEVWNQGRLVIAGDAAHQMPPFAGQGLNSGIRDALNLTWKLDHVLSGDAEPSLLDSYTVERSEHVKFAIHFSIELGKLTCILDPDEARARDVRLLEAGARPDLILPPPPPDTLADGVLLRRPDGSAHPFAGRLFPQWLVESVTGEKLLDDVTGLRAVLMLAPGVDAAAITPVALARFEALGGRVVGLRAVGDSATDASIVDVTGAYTALLADANATAGLQRPDGYFFGLADSSSGIEELVAQYVDEVTNYARTGAQLARK